MSVPFRYNIRSIFYRKTTTALTVLAIALTVCVLVVVLALAAGFKKTVGGTGRHDNVICMRDGAASEGESSVSLQLAQQVFGLPEIARGATGKPLACAELFAAVNLERVDGGTTNVSIRGTTPAALEIRASVKVKGQFFTPGRREVVVGAKLAGRIKGCQIGGTAIINNDEWAVVGVIDSGDLAFDSEIWGDAELMRQLFHRAGFSTVIFRVAEGTELGTPARIDDSEVSRGDSAEVVKAKTKIIPATGLLRRLASDEFQIKGQAEDDYYAAQAGKLGTVIRALAFILAGIMAVGAVFGCTNTLLAAVAGRTQEIGALMAIGFRPRHILIGFMLESLVLGLIGGVLGIVLALPVQGRETGTMNFDTFAEQAFSFQITPTVMVSAVVLAAIVGMLGGTLPALRASRLKPTDAMRGN